MLAVCGSTDVDVRDAPGIPVEYGEMFPVLDVSDEQTTKPWTLTWDVGLNLGDGSLLSSRLLFLADLLGNSGGRWCSLWDTMRVL